MQSPPLSNVNLKFAVQNDIFILASNGEILLRQLVDKGIKFQYAPTFIA